MYPFMELYMSLAEFPPGPVGATPLDGSEPGMSPPANGYLSFFIKVLVFLRGLEREIKVLLKSGSYPTSLEPSV
jgi:hypothetical protein